MRMLHSAVSNESTMKATVENVRGIVEKLSTEGTVLSRIFNSCSDWKIHEVHLQMKPVFSTMWGFTLSLSTMLCFTLPLSTVHIEARSDVRILHENLWKIILLLNVIVFWYKFTHIKGNGCTFGILFWFCFLFSWEKGGKCSFYAILSAKYENVGQNIY